MNQSDLVKADDINRQRVASFNRQVLARRAAHELEASKPRRARRPVVLLILAMLVAIIAIGAASAPHAPTFVESSNHAGSGAMPK